VAGYSGGAWHGQALLALPPCCDKRMAAG